MEQRLSRRRRQANCYGTPLRYQRECAEGGRLRVRTQHLYCVLCAVYCVLRTVYDVLCTLYCVLFTPYSAQRWIDGDYHSSFTV